MIQIVNILLHQRDLCSLCCQHLVLQHSIHPMTEDSFLSKFLTEVPQILFHCKYPFRVTSFTDLFLSTHQRYMQCCSRKLRFLNAEFAISSGLLYSPDTLNVSAPMLITSVIASFNSHFFKIPKL